MTAVPKPPLPGTRMTKHLRAADLRGLARLSTQATVGVADITEGVHRSVLATIGLGGRDGQRTAGLTGLVYRAVRGITRGVGWGFDAALAGLDPLAGVDDRAESTQRLAILAALNGVLGDRLVAQGNPLAITMSLRQRMTGDEVTPRTPVPAPSSRILLMIHGLCMNDLQWHTRDKEGQTHHHGKAVTTALGMTDLYLRYNSGRPVARNGAELSALLQRLLHDWPVEVDELHVLAHSMGGLVIRSAVEQANRQCLEWPRRLKQVVFLGTPHHGAPLERAGHGVDLILAASPWTAPFTRLAAIRSAGITDLRHGRVIEPEAGSSAAGAEVAHLPLSEGIGWRAIAATLAARRGLLADRLVGDGLVPLHSALGRHREASRCLAFDRDSTWIVPQTGHLALLGSPAVAQRIIGWLGETRPASHVGGGDRRGG